MDAIIPRPAPRLPRTRILFCVVMAAALAMAGCTGGRGQAANAGGQSANQSANPDAPSASQGLLTGRVTRGPVSPVSGPGIPARPFAPIAGAELKIFDSKGAVMATTHTGADGSYRLALAPGNYRVERGNGFPGAARNLPAMVAISPGGETRLDVWVDTGIRRPGRPTAIR